MGLLEEPMTPPRASDSHEHSLGAMLVPTVNTQVDTPDVAEFRVTPADTSHKASGDVETLLKKPQGPTDDIVPKAICVEALLNGTVAYPPPPPRPGFRTTSVDEEEHADAGQLTSRGVPDPPLALHVAAPEELKKTAACHTTSSSSSIAEAPLDHQSGPGWLTSWTNISPKRAPLLR